MVKLTFYGGAGEIGGNKILLEDKDAKIYLDAGFFGLIFVTFAGLTLRKYSCPASIS